MPPKKVTLTSGTEIKIGSKLETGDLADLYACTYEEVKSSGADKPRDCWETLMADDLIEDDEDGPMSGLIKIARSISNNDLLEEEAEVLSHRLSNVDGPEAEKGFHRYLPRLIGTAKVRGHHANVFPRYSGYISWETILKAYPSGIDFRDFAWMIKRLWAGIGWAHSKGVIHGAILPSHVLVHPTGHGAKILDWSYSVPLDAKKTIRAYQSNWKDYYAPEILSKQFPTAAADIYMSAKCAVALLGGNLETNQFPEAVPKEIAQLFGHCLQQSPSSRPSSAWDLHERFDGILKKIEGVPKYRPFHLPVGSP